MIQQNTILLDSAAEILSKYRKPGVSEIMINKPGEVWVDVSGNLKCFEDESITMQSINVLVKTIAGMAGQTIDQENPLLSTTLPKVLNKESLASGGERIQVVYEPVVEKGKTSIVMRIPSSVSFTLDDYRSSGAFDKVKRKEKVDPLLSIYEKKRWDEFIIKAVGLKKTIISSGGTSTGKTTFNNTLCSLMGLSERLVTVEDALETIAPQPNQVNMLCTPAKIDSQNNVVRRAITPRELIAASLRMRPDRIIMGELRGSEAFDFLRAVNSGHPGSLTTIHADSTAGALNALSQLVLQANLGWGISDIKNYITSVVDVVIQWKREDDKRYISEIWYKGCPE